MSGRSDAERAEFMRRVRLLAERAAEREEEKILEEMESERLFGLTSDGECDRLASGEVDV